MKVVWTKVALADLASAHAYIAQEAPEAARRTIEKVERAVESITRHPELGKPGRVTATREWLVPTTPFIIAYRLKSNRIEILSVIHGSRLWPDQFQDQ